MDNSMQNMLDMYLYETNTLIEQLDEILLSAEQEGDFSQDAVNEIFRIMHTIKGSSAMMQFNSLSALSHQIENLFFFIRENQINQEFGHDLFDLLFQASDFIKSQVIQIENNEPLNEDISELISGIERFLQQIKGSSDSSDHEKAASATDKTIENQTKEDQNSELAIRVFFDEECGMENLRSFMLITAMQDVCGPFSYEPQNVENDSSTAAYIIEHGFTLYFNNHEDLDAAIGILKTSLNIRTYEILHNQQEDKKVETIEKAEENTEKSSAPAKETEAKKTTAQKKKADDAPMHLSSGKQSLISVNLTKLDRLMDIVGEIVITESMVTSSPDLQGFKLDNFTKSARQLRKLTDDLQDTAMSIRMVPVSSVFQKMNRIVRDMSQALGKEARLVSIGADTEVDKTIVDSIGDPIMHMVRNSMDHGLEQNKEDRIALGKDPQGTITLKAEHTGSEVIITISDDGQGIDTQKVIEKAKERGLLTKPESEYSQREVLQLLLLPGFSTNEEVTEYSGRGVGMDVVKKNIEKVGGIVTMTSEEGKGTSTIFKIPLTLAIVDGMEISVGNSIFTIPIHNIRQSFKIDESDIVHDAGQGEMIQKMDKFYPIIRLNEFFSIAPKAETVSDGIMIWVEAGEKSYCLFVDELLGEQQVVVKPIPTYLSTYNVKDSGIAGCTILGDGNISIILDIINLHTAAIGGAL
ncbi:chemotaxis protein CheA [Sinanaerobacter sp. ZZT-01]|uniref:chemotaxis protein CheA n=1 Tax=Sinanaerobacter sp. ZZT-01 TaxID=3111540 RepID=UPI002D79AE0B|nr:chemotaxis protein CheA [Sinanaerobacter sp. ZZT-01]WRR93577.1 chemotaxis protein CheA [Sinanaerobacter sp. ZZT-01]